MSSDTSADPVLPHTAYPCTLARVAVPDCTVSYMYSAIFPATASLSTCRYTADCPTAVLTPSELTTFPISMGFIITPRLAMVPAIMAMCSGVTSTCPCPMPAHTNSDMPPTSFGNDELYTTKSPNLKFSLNPNASAVARSRSSPSWYASLPKVTLQLFLNAVLRSTSPWAFPPAHTTRPPWYSHTPAQVKGWAITFGSAVTADASVTILNTDPGVYSPCRHRFRNAVSSTWASERDMMS